MKTTPLDNWVSGRLGISGPPDLSTLREYQLRKLRDTIRSAVAYSRFYRRHFQDINPDAFQTMEDVARLPFTTPHDLVDCPADFICVSPQEISRMVTLSTSGTTGLPKRIAFTSEDQELTVDFFHHGMTTLARASDRVLIFLPGKTEGSVGNLLQKAVARFGCEGIVFGPIDDLERAHKTLVDIKPESAVGIPSQLLALSRHCQDTLSAGKVQLRTVLLSTDHASKALVEALGQAWGCEVYDHYGSTEMGLGGAVECQARNGYHMREADLLFELVDPDTGKPVDDGEYGEVVFSTLTRRGMPLIRYRTGDRSRILTEPCPCGAKLRRLERVSGRICEAIQLRNGSALSIGQLDEIVFSNPSVLSYSAELLDAEGDDFLCLKVQPAQDSFDERTLEAGLRQQLLCAHMKLEIQKGFTDFFTNGTAKRFIADKRQDRGRSPRLPIFTKVMV